MKIIKRSGMEVEFDRSKIIAAVKRANNSVVEGEKVSDEQVEKIAENVETICEGMNRALNVEEIQDLVENQIMNQKAFRLASNYITYRYKRALVRKSNSTDKQILSLLECNNEEVIQENSNKNPTVNSVQRDYMAGEVSKDITRRFLLPQKIVDAHEAGIIHFHDSDYFAQHMHNCCLVNLEDMLQNGTVISDVMIEKPKSFSTACNIATQAVAQIASSQYGGQSITLSHLVPFVEISRQKYRRDVRAEFEVEGMELDEQKINEIAEMRVRKEVKQGVQVIQYQVITLMTTNGQAPFVTVFMYLDEVPEGRTREDLALAYTPGVAEPCKVIAKDKEAAYKYTIKSNTIAVVSDGSAVLGLGNIGAHAAMPVMEGKAVLFKEFGNVNAVPVCLDTQDTEEIIKTVVNIAPAFGGINLEDISAPRCFEIETRLKELLDIPVFHDDQHGTAIVVLAGIINGLKVTGKTKEDCQVVVNGAGSAGIAITKLLLTYGFKHVTMCDKSGILSKASEGLNWMQQSMMEVTNLENKTGSLADALRGADIFVGVSAPNIVTADMVKTMNKDAIIFAMANPVPEIMPDVAKAAGAKVVGTGRSDFPNQVNNVIAFPGIFKGALEGRARQITEDMKLAAALAIANLVPDDEVSDVNILPEAFDPRVADVVSKAVIDHIEK